MIDINEEFAVNEKYIVRTFPEEGVEFNGESISQARSTTTDF